MSDVAFLERLSWKAGDVETGDDAVEARRVLGHGSHDQKDHGRRKVIEARGLRARARRYLDRVRARTQTYGRPIGGYRDRFEHEVAAATDFEALQRVWEEETGGAVEEWRAIRAAQINALVDFIEAAVSAGNASAIAGMTAPVLGADVIYEHMRSLAEEAIEEARAEAARQGVTVRQMTVDELDDVIRQRADAVASLMARGISESAARQALLRYGVDALDAAAVAQGVREHLEELSDQYLEDQLGGALTQAQNVARVAVMREAPSAMRLYASELLDLNTCDNCRPVDGKLYGSLEEATQDYPTGGYRECLGGPRCRGTLVAVYEESSPEAPVPTFATGVRAHLPGKHDQATHAPKGIRTGTTSAEMEAKLNAGIESGVAETEKLGAGVDGVVYKVKFNDGTYAVKKTVFKPRNDAEASVEDQIESEVMGAKVANAAGFDHAVVRDPSSADSVYMPYHRGEAYGAHGYFSQPPARPAFVGADEARIGMLDIAMNNNDRHGMNAMIKDDGTVAVIDHSRSLGYKPPFGGGDTVNSIFVQDNFTVTKGPPEGGGWNVITKATTSQLSAADVATFRSNVESLAPDFTAAGRGDWHADVLRRIDAIEATG